MKHVPLESILNTGKSLTGMLVGDVCVRSVLVWVPIPVSFFLSHIVKKKKIKKMIEESKQFL